MRTVYHMFEHPQLEHRPATTTVILFVYIQFQNVDISPTSEADRDILKTLAENIQRTNYSGINSNGTRWWFQTFCYFHPYL